MNLFQRWFGSKPEPVEHKAAEKIEPTPKRRIRPDAVDRFRPAEHRLNPFVLPKHPPGVVPKDSSMAMDDALGSALAWAGSGYEGTFGGVGNYLHEGLGFAGFTYLSELAQRPEYRKIAEVFATEMTRHWIEIQATTDEDDKDDRPDKIKQLNTAMDRLGVRDVFRKAAEHDGLFGGAHIFIDLGKDNPVELATSIGDGADAASKAKIEKGGLKSLKVIEPAWVYPQAYNSTNPLASDWYRPSQWMVMGTPVHATRLLTLIGRVVPDMLKPAYSFRGLSMSQMAKPYVDNWLRTRQSVADIIEAFSVFVLKTDLGDILTGGMGDSLEQRLSLFNLTRDNRGVMALQSGEGANGEEEFQNVSAPLGTLDKLQAQSQEQICSVAKIPLVKFTGITPSGLNATSDGEIRVFYDEVHAYQEHLFRRPLTTIFNLMQLSEFGEIDPALTFKFVPLWSMSEKELAEVRKIEAETDGLLIQEGVILSSEARQRVAGDPDTPYTNIDPDLEIDPPDPGELDPVPEPTLEPGSAA